VFIITLPAPAEEEPVDEERQTAAL
jgi:hypothetical protein